MFLKQKFSENVLWTVVIQKYFRVLFFSIMWYSKLVDSLGKTLVVFCHCWCESREENLFWEADYYITAVACSGQSLSMFSCLFVIHDIFYTSWLHIQTYSARSFFYFTHRNTEFVIKPLLFLGLWILFFKIILLSVLLRAVLFSLSKLTFQPSKKWRRIWTY